MTQIKISITTKDVSQTAKYVGWRVKHVSEGGRLTPDGMPCVNPSLNISSVEFNEKMQWTSWYLMRGGAAMIAKEKWRAVYDNGRAFTNGNGFNKSGDPRADFVNALNVTSPLPKLMKGIVCSGNFIRGQADGDELVVTPGVGAIDATKPIADPVEFAFDVWEKHLFFHATSGRYSNGVWKLANFPQGAGAPIFIPYLLKEEARYPLAWFEKWESNSLPDPLVVYHPV